MKTNLIINDINNSNCYIVWNEETSKCIIIDPGFINHQHVAYLLEKENLHAEYIILTHSHFDHMAGVDFLNNYGKPEIIASRLCSEKIIDPIRNLSYFTELGPIKCSKADILIENLTDGELDWSGMKLKFFSTPGHSLCSICIRIGTNVFVGDTIIKGSRTKITHPDGSREELERSLNMIYKTMPKETMIFPGHGESFLLATQDKSIAL